MTEQIMFKTATKDMQPNDYKSEVTPVWCAGCGYHGILNSIYRALSELNIDPSHFVNISGIGCSSRTPYFIKSYKMHTLHGRAGPVATGTQLARPDLPILITGGDGDGFSIGGGHMPHLARKNVNLTYILMDNHIYGLTKGQVSPTSRVELKAYTTPYGGVEEPVKPLQYMLAYNSSYVAQGYAGKPALCKELIREAMEHRGFSFVNILSNCPTYNDIDTPQFYKEIVKEVPEDHDVTSIDAATHLVNSYIAEGKEPLGVIYKVERPTLCDQMSRLVEEVGGSPDYDVRKIIDLSKP